MTQGFVSKTGVDELNRRRPEERRLKALLKVTSRNGQQNIKRGWTVRTQTTCDSGVANGNVFSFSRTFLILLWRKM